MATEGMSARWEYYRLNFLECRKTNTTLVDSEKLIARLNELGRKGWDLVSFDHNWQHETAGFAILKRPLPSEMADGDESGTN